MDAYYQLNVATILFGSYYYIHSLKVHIRMFYFDIGKVETGIIN